MSDTITVIGNIATDPEHRRTPSGVAVTTFRVASGQRRFDRASGQWIESGTNWYSVSTFRGLADHAFHSLRKGDRVLLTGRLRVRAWESGGKHGTAVEIDADAIGHDLLWGTTTFSKDVPTVATGTGAEAQARPAEPDSWAPRSGDAQWSVPGADASPAVDDEPGDEPRGDEPGGDEPGGDEQRVLELVGADTPF